MCVDKERTDEPAEARAGDPAPGAKHGYKLIH